jgi:hypothetical protein
VESAPPPHAAVVTRASVNPTAPCRIQRVFIGEPPFE